jgi:NADH-quinone oxidoreductase subunit K
MHNIYLQKFFSIQKSSFQYINIPTNDTNLIWEPLLWNTNSLELYIDHKPIINFISLICLGYLVFFIGFIGFFFFKGSLLFCLITIELMFVGLNFLIIFLGFYLQFFFSQLFVLCLLTLSAAETAIGLSLLLLYHKQYLTTTLRLLKTYNY